MDCSLPGSSIHEILQARILEWVAISFSRGSSQPRDRTWVSLIGGRRFNLWATREAVIIKVLWKIVCVRAKLLQSCPTLCDPMDCSPPCSFVPGILQARTLEWVAISFSNAWKWKSKWSRSVVSDSLRLHGLQPTRVLRPWDFLGKSTGVGCHCLLHGGSQKLYVDFCLCWGSIS